MFASLKTPGDYLFTSLPPHINTVGREERTPGPLGFCLFVCEARDGPRVRTHHGSSLRTNDLGTGSVSPVRPPVCTSGVSRWAKGAIRPYLNLAGFLHCCSRVGPLRHVSQDPGSGRSSSGRGRPPPYQWSVCQHRTGVGATAWERPFPCPGVPV